MRKPCFIVTFCSMIVITTILTSCTRSTSERSADLPADLEKIENLTIYPAGMETKVDMRFERERSIGDSPELTIGRTGGFAVDDLGRMYLSDVKKIRFTYSNLMVHISHRWEEAEMAPGSTLPARFL